MLIHTLQLSVRRVVPGEPGEEDSPMKESAQFRSFLVSGNGTFYGQSSSWAMSAPSARSRDYYSGTHATYSLQDVAKHCTPEDCWVIIHNAVYDVSNYLDKHPGGAGLVLKCAGM